jgi:hypothetical protein
MTTKELIQALERMPPGSMVPAAGIAETLRELTPEDVSPGPVGLPPTAVPEPWRVRLWTCPAETRLGVSELCEALGRSKDWLYKRTGEAAQKKGQSIPHRKLQGVLLFRAGEIREWLRENEEIVERGPCDAPPGRIRTPRRRAS